MRSSTSTAEASSSEGYTLPRSARVIQQREFRRIYSRGKRASGRQLTVVALRRRAPGHRLGLSVSKAHGCAVVRNKIKRILREAFRLERPAMPGRFDIVLIPKQPTGTKYRLCHLRAELCDLLAKIERGKGRSRGNGHRTQSPRRGRR